MKIPSLTRKMHLYCFLVLLEESQSVYYLYQEMKKLFFVIIQTTTLFFLLGCQATYLIKNGYHQALIIKNQKPIDDYLNSGQLSEDEKSKLRLVNEVKFFAENELGLKKTSNYTHYVKLPYPFVTYLVQVAYPFELKYYKWKFPIVGTVPYKGHFIPDDAKKEAELYSQKGYDTFVRGVRAFSTLGWLNDPVLSSMMGYSEEELTNVIIHELTHATIFIKSEIDFNEQLATFIGNKGTELFFLKKEGKESKTLLEIKKRNQDAVLFSKFIMEELKKLEEFYIKKPSLEEKNLEIQKIQERFKKIKFQTATYNFFTKIKLNNASLLGFKTYVEDLSHFEKVYLDSLNMKDFLVKMKKLENSKNPKSDLLKL